MLLPKLLLRSSSSLGSIHAWKLLVCIVHDACRKNFYHYGLSYEGNTQVYVSLFGNLALAADEVILGLSTVNN